jgi:hypothetical protein
MRRWLFALVALAVVGCSDQTISEPDPQPQSLLGINLGLGGLTFFRFESSAYAAAEKSGSFWAVKGQDRQLTLKYSDTGTEFVRFEVNANSLYRRPNGALFQDGDSILISVTVDASGRMRYAFQPSGLKFNSSAPARLTLDYSRADAVSKLLGAPLIFRRDYWWLGWFPVPTINLFGTAVQTDVNHFTDFALAVS